LSCSRQVPLPVVYKGIKLDCGYRIDVLVNDLIIIELKTVEKLLPIHDAQLLTYLKLYKRPLGLLMNFNVPVLNDGIKSLVNQFQELSASPRLGGE
jgi:GxxExxY protein